jgi:hypothetical protein
MFGEKCLLKISITRDRIDGFYGAMQLPIRVAIFDKWYEKYAVHFIEAHMWSYLIE